MYLVTPQPLSMGPKHWGSFASHYVPMMILKGAIMGPDQRDLSLFQDLALPIYRASPQSNGIRRRWSKVSEETAASSHNLCESSVLTSPTFFLYLALYGREIVCYHAAVLIPNSRGFQPCIRDHCSCIFAKH
jgi:hypothetical protein